MTIDAGLSPTEAMEQLADIDDEVIETGAEQADEADDYDEIDAEADDIQADADEAEEPEEAIDGEDEEEADIEPETAIEAPSFMDATQRAEFANLPTEAQQIVARQSQMLQADYTRKSQETAEKNKALDARTQQLAALQTAAETRLQEWRKVDWVELKRNVSADDFLMYQAQAAQDQQEFQNIHQSYEQQRAERVQSHVQEQMQQLPDILPEAMDPEKGPALVKEIQTALLQADMTADGLQMVTAKQMSLVNDALKWRKAQAKRKTLRPKSDAKTTSKPMRAKARASSSQKAGKRSQQFRKNPSKQNAMAVLAEID